MPIDAPQRKTGPARTPKRSDYLSWDQYFFAVALVSAQRSKDPSTQVGAVLVSPRKRIVGVGYNGFPTGCSDDVLPWTREAADPLDTKYPYACHAELNAVLNGFGNDLSGCTLYTVLYPCNECAKPIIQVGIREVVYISDKYADKWEWKASKTMLREAGVVCRQYVPTGRKIQIEL